MQVFTKPSRRAQKPLWDKGCATRPFAAGGTATGRFLNGLGAYAQNTARQVIQIFAQTNTEKVYEEIDEDVPIVVQESTRVIDFFVRAKDGISNLRIEAKYGLPQGGAALTRLAGQVSNSLQSGLARQVVVWTLKEPTIPQVTTVLTALGANASQVQFVHGAEGLFQYLQFYFGI